MWLNHKFCAMVACHLNFQFQVLAFWKGTKELGVDHLYCECTLWVFLIYVLSFVDAKIIFITRSLKTLNFF